ncbi:MAG: hypothetical protein LBQ32_07055 [Burkholderiaceae bacterium]|nr:hypothetical protein [Burkholderiaceae bacterium]
MAFFLGFPHCQNIARFLEDGAGSDWLALDVVVHVGGIVDIPFSECPEIATPRRVGQPSQRRHQIVHPLCDQVFDQTSLRCQGIPCKHHARGAGKAPIGGTPIIVTLEQLRSYDHDPRVGRNPAYEDIKESIRERGLDTPPAITRWPGEAHYK